MKTHIPPDWLLDDTRNDPDPEFGDAVPVFSIPNRFQRLLVADWVMNGPEPSLDMRAALALYEGSGRRSLLDDPGRLTVAGIYAEVLSLLEAKEAGRGAQEKT